MLDFCTSITNELDIYLCIYLIGSTDTKYRVAHLKMSLLLFRTLFNLIGTPTPQCLVIVYTHRHGDESYHHYCSLYYYYYYPDPSVLTLVFLPSRQNL